jgi:hypothetical protein
LSYESRMLLKNCAIVRHSSERWWWLLLYISQYLHISKLDTARVLPSLPLQADSAICCLSEFHFISSGYRSAAALARQARAFVAFLQFVLRPLRASRLPHLSIPLTIGEKRPFGKTAEDIVVLVREIVS